ncbi:MAG: hypothetical protein H6R15_3350, partial [Proteobacteria bacterium]|nr:hypothetical protein [Pseudomonadota bacterium]
GTPFFSTQVVVGSRHCSALSVIKECCTSLLRPPSQRKGDPRVGAPFGGPLRYSKPAGAAELGPAGLKQSSPFFRRFLRCSAPPMGAREASRTDGSAQEVKTSVISESLEKANNRFSKLNRDAFPGPLRGAEQRRLAGGFRLALSEPQASLASRPDCRVAQGTRAAGTDPGSPSSLATFFLAKQEESTPARKAEPQAN